MCLKIVVVMVDVCCSRVVWVLVLCLSSLLSAVVVALRDEGNNREIIQREECPPKSQRGAAYAIY